MRTYVGIKMCGIAVALPLLLLQVTESEPRKVPKSEGAWEDYFPAKLGSSWSYRIQGTNDGSEGKVTHTVRQVEKTERGKVISIWASPKGEDEGAQLLLSDKGLEDTPTGFYLLKFPVVSGDVWAYKVDSITLKREVTVRFRVVSNGSPCQAGTYRFADCVVIEQNDPDARLDTVTYYAKNVGPVKFVYSQLPGPGENRPLSQTLELRSYFKPHD